MLRRQGTDIDRITWRQCGLTVSAEARDREARRLEGPLTHKEW